MAIGVRAILGLILAAHRDFTLRETVQIVVFIRSQSNTIPLTMQPQAGKDFCKLAKAKNPTRINEILNQKNIFEDYRRSY